MNKIRLDTDTNQLVLVDDVGNETRYRPLAGSAKDLYDTLKGLAQTNPDQVIGTLESAAHLVTNENGPASTSATVSGNIPWVASRSSNPDSKDDAKKTNQPKKVDYSKGGTFEAASGNAQKLIAKANELAKANQQPMIWRDKGRGYVQLVTSAKPELELPLSSAEQAQIDAYLDSPDGFAEAESEDQFRARVLAAPVILRHPVSHRWWNGASWVGRGEEDAEPVSKERADELAATLGVKPERFPYTEADETAAPAVDPTQAQLPTVDYASWETSLGDGVAQINRQDVNGQMVVTARDSTGNVMGTYTGDQTQGVATPKESAILSDEQIDQIAERAIDFLNNHEANQQ